MPTTNQSVTQGCHSLLTHSLNCLLMSGVSLHNTPTRLSCHTQCVFVQVHSCTALAAQLQAILETVASSCCLTGLAHTSQGTPHDASNSSHFSNNKQLPPSMGGPQPLPALHLKDQVHQTPLHVHQTLLIPLNTTTTSDSLYAVWFVIGNYRTTFCISLSLQFNSGSTLAACVGREGTGKHVWFMEGREPPHAGHGQRGLGTRAQAALHTERGEGKQSWLEGTDTEVRGGQETAGYQLTCINLARSQGQQPLPFPP